MGWKYYNRFVIMSDKYPHEILDSNCIPWNSFKGAFVAQWTSDFDCSHETQFWYCIKDNSFDISKLKAKRRYEINKGIKNFNVCPIDPKKLFRRSLSSLFGENEWV